MEGSERTLEELVHTVHLFHDAQPNHAGVAQATGMALGGVRTSPGRALLSLRHGLVWRGFGPGRPFAEAS